MPDRRDDEAVIAEALDMMDWYRRCLEDMQDGRPVRGLAEAKAGYDAGKTVLASLSLRLQNAETALPTTAELERLREHSTALLRKTRDEDYNWRQHGQHIASILANLTRRRALASSAEQEPATDQAVVAAAKACLDQWAQGRGNPPRLMSVERRLADLTGWFYSDPLEPYFGPRPAEREPESETTCTETEGCGNGWHYWRCPSHHLYEPSA